MTTDTEPVAPAEPPARPSVVRRHPWAFAIPAALVAVILVSGLTAWGVSSLVQNSSTPVAATAPMASGKAAPAKPIAGARTGVRGTITAIDGSMWTIDTKAGVTVTISVTSSTSYGTKAVPASVSDFAVGDSVAVIGTRTGDTGVATRVIKTNGVGTKPTPSGSPNT